MAETESIDLKQYLASATPIEEELTFGSGQAAFDVRVRRLDRAAITDLFNVGKKKIRGRNGEYREEQDIGKLRRALAETALIGWSDLTLRKVALMTNHDAVTLNGNGDVQVNFTVDNAIALLESARGYVNGEPVALEDWLLDAVTQVADRAAREEAAGKNA